MSNRSAAKTLLASIKDLAVVRVGRPGTEHHIARAERELGVRLPGLYRELLKLAGQIDIWEMSMFGLGPSAQRWGRYKGITVTELTQMARREPDVRLPEHLIAIWHDSHRDYQCLDTSRVRRGDCPVVLFDTKIAASARRRPKRIARGLGEWLRLRIRVAVRQKEMVERHVVDPETGNKGKRGEAKGKRKGRYRASASRV